MGRKRKGLHAESSRHMRRLAEQSATAQLAQNEPVSKTTASFQLNDVCEVESRKSLSDDNFENANSNFDFCHSVNLFSSNLSVNDEIGNFNSDENIGVSELSDVRANDDTHSIDSCDINRHSDSEAESIPDLEDSFDLCLNLVHKNATKVRDEQFLNELNHWAITYKINHNALRSLLALLNKYTDTTFPKDPRTLLKTPRVTNVEIMQSGEYCHLGLGNALKTMIKLRFTENDIDAIDIFVNIDGAPLAGNSSEKGLWLILCRDITQPNVYPIGIYYGVQKPEDSNVFLKPFVDEAKEILSNGFTIGGKKYIVNIEGFICDAPAKSFILCTKYHSGYDSCSKCLIKGVHYSSICFPYSCKDELQKFRDTCLRTDSDFKQFKYRDNYQRSKSILNELPRVGMVSKIVLDGMHIFYLGVMKQLIRHWLGNKGRSNKAYKLSAIQIKQISDRLENLKFILPNDFNRRCRSLIYWKQWKATEYRHFLLYFGPFILRDVLKPKVYKNFLYLSISTLILSNKELIKEHSNIDYAEKLLTEFIFSFQKIYGKDNVTFNIHCLLHFCKDVKNFGSLEHFSAFPFENYICSVKKMVRKGEKVLAQIARRLSEYISLNDIKNTLNSRNIQIKVEKNCFNGILTQSYHFDSQYKILIVKSVRIDTSDERNNCVMLLDGTVVNVLNIAMSENIVYIIGKPCENVRALFEIPGFSSRQLSINIVKEIDHTKEWPSNMIHAKVFKVSCSEGIIVFPILHTLAPFQK